MTNKKLVKIVNKHENGTWYFPVAFLRYAYISGRSNEEKYFVKALGMSSRIEVNKEMFDEVVAVLETVVVGDEE